MDANGARFWLLAGPRDLAPAPGADAVAWDAARRVLVLASQRPTPELVEDDAAAKAAREAVPDARDAYGSLARVARDGGEDVVLVRFEGLAEREIFRRAAPDPATTEVLFGDDGVIAIAHAGVVHLKDSRVLGDEREDWRVLEVDALAPESAPLSAWRLAPRPGRGGWILDRSDKKLAFWDGTVPRSFSRPRPAPGTFRPEPEEPRTLWLRVTYDGGFDGDEPGGLATSPSGRVAVLGLREDQHARVHLFTAEGELEHVAVLDGVAHPTSVAWVGDDRLAVLARADVADGAVEEALVYRVTGSEVLRLTGERYPLRGHTGAAFVRTPDGSPRYPTAAGARPLVALSLPHRAPSGQAVGRYLDSGRADTTWHRLNIEARIPEGCGIRVELAASDQHEAPSDEEAWYPHDFGTTPGRGSRVPVGAWVPAHSELPHWTGLLGAAPQLERAGTFTVLVQRSTRRTTRLVGRFLHTRVTLYGSGRASPQLAAVRAWSPRFSYVREYLPALYHEDPQLDGGDEVGNATAADFLERFLCNFEGVLTPLEDRVAGAWQLTNPKTAPPDALEWLAGWIGRSLDPALPEEARRAVLLVAPELSRWRGTKRGLELALEAVTGGGITRGDLLVLEDWRLRRTWATILGADLADDADPLLAGLAISSNSLVGDTLVLGDENRREFLALYGEEVFEGPVRTWREAIERIRDRWTVRRFLEQTAHRATVLVFDAVDDEAFGLVERVVQTEAPAYVGVRVRRASRSFITGVTALVGVDTRLNLEPEPETVRLGETRIGQGDRLRRPPALHPDLEGSPPEGDGG